MTFSCVYEGWVRHRRFEPIARDFRYPLFLVYLDLDELPELFDGTLAWSARRAAPVRFRRSDYLGDPDRSLREEVLKLVRERTGVSPGGPVRLLTQLRQYGFSFNPVSFYYCFDPPGRTVEAVVAEVTNTPWGERHAYVLGRTADGPVLADRLGKDLHVSPFLGMDGDYEWRVSEPGDSLRVHIENRASARRVFDATLSLKRRELERGVLRRLVVRYPAAPLVVIARIYLQALQLKLKGVRHYPHPSSRALSPARSLVLAGLRRIRGGHLMLVEGGRRMSFGPAEAELRATVEVHDPAAWRRFLRGSHGVADAYIDGLWDCDDLVSLVRIGAREMPRLDRLRRVALPLRRLLGRVPANTRAASRRHVAAHYDLGNELFAAFLDETMTYSGAVFDDPGQSLREAQEAKLDGACRKLELSPEDHLLEVGTGWGSLAIHAAARYGCRVTTTTISREQGELARRRVREAGLEDRVTVLSDDYRELSGRYDKLVAIEMIEAVGWQYLDAFFACCAELLEPDGLMLLQAITIDDRHYELEKATRSFANTYVFPAGCLPSLGVIRRCVESADLTELAVEDLTASYPITLRHWRRNFLAAGDRIADLGYDERFRRLWELYLSWCEGGFLERRIQDYQLLLGGRTASRSPVVPPVKAAHSWRSIESPISQNDGGQSPTNSARRSALPRSS